MAEHHKQHTHFVLQLYIYFKATFFVKYKYKWDILITKLKQKWHTKNYFTAIASLLYTSSVPKSEYQHLKTLLYNTFCSFHVKLETKLRAKF